MTQYPYQTAEETPQSYSLGGFESVKPPRGVKPVVIWIEDRIKEVSRVIAEYVEVGMYTKAEEWTPELYQLFHYRKVYLQLKKGEE